MRRQTNNPQMNRKEESPESVLNEIEASNIADTEFKIMLIRMLKELSGSYSNMKKDMETTNTIQEEIKKIVSEMKNTTEQIKSRLNETEYRTSELEDR